MTGRLAGEKAGMEELNKLQLVEICKEKVTALRGVFAEAGVRAGRESGIALAKSVLAKISLEAILDEVKSASAAAGEKYAVKAREFQRLCAKIAEEAGGNAGEEEGENVGGEAGEAAGGDAGENVGREAGRKAGLEIAGEEGAQAGAEAGAKAGRKFGLKVGRDAGIKAGIEVGRLEGRKAGAAAGAAEALKHFKIGITKERVAALKRVFAEIGAAAGLVAAKASVGVAAAKRGEEEGSKFAMEHGRKAGEAAARKLKEAEGKILKEEGATIGEQAGGEAGEKAGAEEGERVGATEAERLGAEEGERIGREIGGEEVISLKKLVFYQSNNKWSLLDCQCTVE
jgi:hypothetical protein